MTDSSTQLTPELLSVLEALYKQPYTQQEGSAGFFDRAFGRSNAHSMMQQLDRARQRNLQQRFPLAGEAPQSGPNTPVVPNARPNGTLSLPGTQTQSSNNQPPSRLSGDMAHYAGAISNIESGGRYDLVGPRHPQLGRALGRFQVMEANLPAWLKAAGLPRMTADQFLANPEAQDQVFNHRFGLYLNQFGNPIDSAQAWFAGPGSIGARNAGNRRDSLGTTVARYRDSFANHLARQPAGDLPQASQAPGPARVAAATDAPAAPGSAPAPSQATPAGPRMAQAGPPPAASPQLPVGVPPRIEPNPNIRLLEQQLTNAAAMPEEQRTSAYNSYLQAVGPQSIDTPSGTAFYRGSDGQFMYLVPKLSRRPISAGGVSTEELLMPQQGGFGVVPTGPMGGDNTNTGANAPTGDRTTYGTPRQMPQTGQFGDYIQFGQESEVAKQYANTQSQIRNDLVQESTRLPAVISALRAMETAIQRGGAWVGPGSSVILDLKRAASNIPWLAPLVTDIDKLSQDELFNKLQTMIGAMQTRGLTSRPSQFDFQQLLAASPGLQNSSIGSRVLVDYLRQEMQHQIAVARIVNRLQPNEIGQLQEKIEKYYQDSPIVITIPSHRLGGSNVPEQRIDTRQLPKVGDPKPDGKGDYSQQDVIDHINRVIPRGHYFLDPHDGAVRPRGN